nr:DEAD/DEAH box helicase [Acanthopleuribacter pedis]
MEPEQAPSLDATNLTLRPYQENGYRWLYFLYQNGLGGLLCDQMGLGKTHQGMALLAAVTQAKPESRHLVVAPASVLYHWKDKLNAFCPDLKPRIHHGGDRDVAKALKNAQVIITSYATLRNDAELFGSFAFQVILFDEAQYLKNSATKSFQAISKLRALCKIGLTGTPIENQLSELKALMDLVFPGFLGSSGHFKRHFMDPISNFDNPLAKARLRDIIHPFTLRRNKSEVLIDLPTKSEDRRGYALSEYEKDLYITIKKQGVTRIKTNEARGKQLMHAFQVLDMLKRLCNHPALHFKNTDYAAYPSAKWSAFTELLQEAFDAGEKVVVFTQFLGMIDIFKRYLDDRNIRFACITGQVKDRGRQQAMFQEDPACRVFLGTIMAAGTGIDLTAASVLFHYDRWWNAAREEQATDRIHRIGQNKAVQIFKFQGIDTVEERIDGIIRRKAKLLEEVVTFDNEQVGKHLSLEELLEVLA